MFQCWHQNLGYIHSPELAKVRIQCGHFSVLYIPVIFQTAGVLAALNNPNHLLVVDLKINRLIGIILLAAFLHLEIYWV
ncbi:hypothetical protein DVP78_09100 [Yersinia enterocolitica]|nr:hypothetical protein [Yersinia enterocolitica]EKN6176977.1 hypothetical protein [Yersinia enterocolitica]EKN6345381.1 hypothetical protein [Yersinia enterocolitica]